MSARDMMLPDDALADILKEIDANITALERRAQWPGAAHLAQGGVIGPFQAGSWITTLSEAALVSLTVDPGRWVFFASVSMYLQRESAISWPFGGQLHTYISVTGATAAAHRARQSVGLSASRQGALTDVVSNDSDVPVTATIRAGGNYASNPIPPAGSNGIWGVQSSILIAFPA